MGAAGGWRHIDLRQPAAVLGQHLGQARLRGQVPPLVGIGLQVVELFAAVGILNEPPPLAADGVVALVVAGDRWPHPRHVGIGQLWTQADPLEVGAGREAGEVNQRGIDVEQLSRLAAPLSGRHAGAGEDQGHLRAAVPEGVLAGDRLLAEVPAVIAPDNHDRVVGEACVLEGGEQSPDLGVDKARAGEVAPHEVSPLVVLLEPRQPRLRQRPVEVPGKPRGVAAVVGEEGGQHRVVVGVEVKPLLRGVAGHMRQEEAGRQEEGLVPGGILDLLDGPARDLVVALRAVVVVGRPDAPVHQWMVAHRRGWDQLLRRRAAHAAKGGGQLKLWGPLGCWSAGLGPRAGAAVVDLAGGGGVVAVGREVLRQGHPVGPFWQRAKPGSEAVDAGGRGPQTEQQACP